MKTAALISAQFHRNPQLIEVTQDAGIPHVSRRPLRRGRRRRRP
jgi:hypothetical protein